MVLHQHERQQDAQADREDAESRCRGTDWTVSSRLASGQAWVEPQPIGPSVFEQHKRQSGGSLDGPRRPGPQQDGEQRQRGPALPKG